MVISREWSKKLFWPLLLIAIAGTHLWFSSKYLFDWDAVQFALALEDFDIMNHQPHPPGYILLVAFVRIIYFFLHDANQAYLFFNFLSHIFSTILVYFICQNTFQKENLSKSSALLFAFSPLVQFNCNITCAYGAESLVALSLALTVSKTIQTGSLRSLVLTTLIFSLGGGIRQNLIFLLFPLWAFGLGVFLWKFELNLKQFCGVILIFILGICAWFVPLVILTGGIHAYQRESSSLLLFHFSQTSIFYGISWVKFCKIILRLFGWLSILGLGLASIPLLLNLKIIFQKIKENKKNILIPFYVLWILPSFFFYAAFHLPKPGYLMTFFGAFCIFAAYSMKLTFKHFYPITFLIVISFFGQFLLPTTEILENKNLNQNLREAIGKMCIQYSLAAIREKDALISDLTTTLRENFDPKTDALITENWRPSQKPNRRWLRHMMFYAPSFDTYEISNPIENPSIYHVRHKKTVDRSFAKHEEFSFEEKQKPRKLNLKKNQILPHENLIFVTGDFVSQTLQAPWQKRQTPLGQIYYVYPFSEIGDRLEYAGVIFHHQVEDQ